MVITCRQVAALLAVSAAASLVFPTRHAWPQGSAAESRKKLALAEEINAAIKRRASSLGDSRIGVIAVDAATGELVYSRDADGLYNTASNTKLITTAAALALLGPDFRFRTEALAEEIDDRGAVKGDLYVRGRGNPSFGIDSLEEFVRQIHGAGVTKINGSIVIDSSYFDDADTPPHFDEQPEEEASFRAPISATSLNFNSMTVMVRPANRGTGEAIVEVEPVNDYVQISSTVRTVSRGRTRVRIDTTTSDDALVLAVSGQIRKEASPRLYRRRIANPARFFAAALRSALAREGISVARTRSKAEVTPATARLVAVHESLPLAVLVRGLGKYSNNYVAEMLLKTIGAELTAGGAPATWEHGLSAVRSFLNDEIGLAPDSYRYGNGSGLFESNEFSPRQLARILAVAHRDFRWGPDFVASLSIAGADGTLSRRMLDTPAERLVRAKTGTLATVSALAGLAATDARAPIAFAVLVNDIPRWKGNDARDLQDDIAAALVAFTRD